MVDREATARFHAALAEQRRNAEPPRGAQLPVPRNAVLRYEEMNGETSVLFLE
jgi:hypothetical protein